MDVTEPNSLAGRSILVGITYVDADGKLDRMVQHFGTIRIVTDTWQQQGRDGPKVEVPTIVVERDGGELVGFPYDKDALVLAKKGTYRMRSTGEEIVDPDLLSQWQVKLAPEAPVDSLEAQRKNGAA